MLKSLEELFEGRHFDREVSSCAALVPSIQAEREIWWR